MHTRLKYPLPLLAAACLIVIAPTQAQEVREVYDLKVYELKSEEKAALFDTAMEEIGVAALKASGASAVGVFGEKPGEEDTHPSWRYVLTVYPSADAYAKALTFDFTGIEVGDHLPYLMATKDEAAFARVRGSLFLAFGGRPTHTDPDGDGGGDRFFELRIYESPSEGKGILKVEMFDQSELAIFEKVGLESVFFGQAVVAPNLPQLTYMLVYEDEEAQKAAWDAFRESPDWAALKGEERYADTVSDIHSTLLVALPYSGIR